MGAWTERTRARGRGLEEEGKGATAGRVPPVELKAHPCACHGWSTPSEAEAASGRRGQPPPVDGQHARAVAKANPCSYHADPRPNPFAEDAAAASAAARCPVSRKPLTKHGSSVPPSASVLTGALPRPRQRLRRLAIVATPNRLRGGSLPSLSSQLPTHGNLPAPPLCPSLVGPHSLLGGCLKRQSGLTVGMQRTNVRGGSHFAPPRAFSAAKNRPLPSSFQEADQARPERPTGSPIRPLANCATPPRAGAPIPGLLWCAGGLAATRICTHPPPHPPTSLPIRFSSGRAAHAPGRRRSCVTTPTFRSNTTVSNRSTHTPLSGASPTRTVAFARCVAAVPVDRPAIGDGGRGRTRRVTHGGHVLADYCTHK